ncbi:hypothetical protein DCO49_02565 [Stenotrophomonas sp. SPM]|nr:hypothetical protein DCO49_02565 [Stenotrophomonas sp. SPM]
MTASDFPKCLCVVLVLLAGLNIHSAFAEGHCPPGQYPSGDQGVGGCAPIPGAGQSAPEENPGYWVKTWGAVASSPGGDAGSATGHQAKAAAERQAVERCGLGGATDCAVVFTYYNQCYAVVRANRPDNGMRFNTGATRNRRKSVRSMIAGAWEARSVQFSTLIAPSPSSRKGEGGSS